MSVIVHIRGEVRCINADDFALVENMMCLLKSQGRPAFEIFINSLTHHERAIGDEFKEFAYSQMAQDVLERYLI